MRLSPGAILVLLVLLLLLGGCGGGGPQLQRMGRSAGPVDTVQASLPVLPDAEAFNPSRIAAAFETTRSGNQSDSSGGAVTPGLGYADFAPLAQQLAWAIYRFDGVPADQATQLDFMLANVTLGSQAWFAVSDYSSQSWVFLPPQTASGSLALDFGPGDLTSPSGQIYVAVVAHDLDKFRLQQLGLSFASRYSVSGQVVDESGAPIAGALVTTTLDSSGVLSDGAGNFTLPTIPDGTWHLMAAKDGYVFFANPLEVSVDGADFSGVEFLGINNRSHFTLVQGPEPNNSQEQAADWDGGTRADSLSITDDYIDQFRVEVDAPGQYYVLANCTNSLLFPMLRISHGVNGNASSSFWGCHGAVYAPFVATEPGEFIVSLDISGGGGTYSLELHNGQLARMGGRVLDEEVMVGAGMGYVRLKADDTELVTNIFAPEGDLDWGAWLQRQAYSVTPLDSDYEFTPASQLVLLGAGDVLDVEFGASATGFGDQGEPNNNDMTATAQTLPWTSPLGSLSVGADDIIDYYTVQPAAGNYMRVRLLMPPGSIATRVSAVQASIFSSSDEAYFELQVPGALELRTPEPCDGGPYWIVVSSDEARRFSYGIVAEEYSGRRLEVHASVDGQPLAGARADVYSASHGWFLDYELQTDDAGVAELGCALMEGEELGVEFFRFGLDSDRQTRRVTAAGDDINLSFDASSSASADTHEPNSKLQPADVALPALFSATINESSDHFDYYRLDVPGLQPVKVSWDTGDSPFILDFTALEDADEGIFLAEFSGSSGSQVFSPHPAGSVLRVSTRAGGNYTLQIQPVDAYRVIGTVRLDGVTPLGGVGLYVPQTGSTAITAADGSYTLGPLEPGTYDLVCYSVNHVSDPVSPHPFTLSVADLQQDFSLSYNNTDSGEPAVDDDIPSESRTLTDGQSISANLDSDNTVDPSDSVDWYGVTATGPGLLSVKLSVEQAWAAEGLYVAVYDDLGADLGFFELEPGGKIPVRLALPAAGYYYFSVQGADVDYSLTVDFPAD